MDSANGKPASVTAHDNGQALFARKPRIKTCNRVAAALYNQMKRLACFSVIFLTPQFTHAQVESGTVVLFQLVHNKFIIAADSRATDIDGRRPPDDTHCKITTLGQEFVFAPTGAVEYRQGGLFDFANTWNAEDEIRTAVAMNPVRNDVPPSVQINIIADTWVGAIKTDWFGLYLVHPEQVKKIAERQHGGLTIGIFALMTNGDIAITTRGVRYGEIIETFIPFPQIEECKLNPCAAGETDVASEYILNNTPRARAESYSTSPEVLAWLGRDMARIIRITDLAIAGDTTGTIGGKIDALELSLSNGKHWRQRKDNCPETNDYN